MSAYNDKRRDIKRAYRKKALQTNMSQISDSVDATPLPIHSYSTTTTQESQVVRPAQDPRTYGRVVRPAVEHLDFARAIDSARYPWHLAPKADSANVIARTSYDFSAASADVADNEYYDVLVLNIADSSNTETPGPGGIGTGGSGTAAGDRGLTPTQNAVTENIPAGAETGIGNPEHPGGGGATTAGVAGTTRIAAPGEIYRIRSFGHSEVTTANFSVAPTINTANPVIYQIWVDSVLFMEWSNFQFASVTPQSSQWAFEQPITVTQQIVFRVINQTGQAADTGDMEVAFSGWSEQLSGYEDVSYQQLENT